MPVWTSATPGAACYNPRHTRHCPTGSDTRMRVPHFLRKLEPNPVTREAYRRQVRAQVYAPLVLGLIVVAGVGAWLWREGVGSTRVWADAATILLMLPLLVIGLLGLIAVAAAAYALAWLIGWLPGYTHQAQRILTQAQGQLTRASDLAVTPVTVPRAAWAAARAGVAVLADFIRGKGWLHGE